VFRIRIRIILRISIRICICISVTSRIRWRAKTSIRIRVRIKTVWSGSTASIVGTEPASNKIRIRLTEPIYVITLMRIRIRLTEPSYVITLMRIRIRILFCADQVPDFLIFIWCGSGCELSLRCGPGSQLFMMRIRFLCSIRCGSGSDLSLWCRSGSASASNKNQEPNPHLIKLEPDPYQSDKSYPDPHQIKIRNRMRIKVIP
jgi:hypothetical protein